MALKPPKGDKGLIPVVMFPNQGKGFGYGKTRMGENGTLPEGYDRTINMTISDGGGALSPSFATTINQAIASKSPGAFLIPWTDSSGTPIAVHGSGNYVRLYKNSAVTLETDATPDVAFTAAATDGGNVKVTVGSSSSFATGDTVVVTGSSVAAYNGNWTVTAVADGTHVSFNATYSATATGTITRSAEYASACLWDDGSGTEYLYAGTKTGRKLLNKRTRAGVWTELSDTADHKAIFVAAGGGKMWATVNDYQIKNWPAGTDPDAGTPSSSIYVGSQSAKITSLGVIGAVPVVGKEDGIWIYNTADNLFEPALPTQFNPLNFPFMEPDGSGGLFTATADGALVHIERFGTISRVSPLEGKSIGRDTPQGRIVDVTTYSDHGYALMDNAWRRNERVPSFQVYVVSGISGAAYNPTGAIGASNFLTPTTITDYTSLVTDGRDDTYLDLSAFDTLANGQALYIGAANKFLLSYFRIVGANNTNARFKYAFLVSNTLGFEFNPFFNGTDTTPFSTSTSFGQSGFLAAQADRQNLAANGSGWASLTINSVAGYWIVVFTI